jgi:hypothetical protein
VFFVERTQAAMSWMVHREWLFVNAHVERDAENRLAEENENSVRIFRREDFWEAD